MNLFINGGEEMQQQEEKKRIMTTKSNITYSDKKKYLGACKATLRNTLKNWKCTYSHHKHM